MAIGAGLPGVAMLPLIGEARDDGEYTQADVDLWARDFDDRLARHSPDVIVTLGRWSSRYFLGDVDMDEVHSIPWEYRGFVVFPMFSTGAGFRNPDMAAKISYGWGQLAAYLAGKLQPQTLYGDEFEGNETYVEITDPTDIKLATGLAVSIDSEGYPGRGWSVQYSQRPGEGYLIRRNRTDLLDKLGRELKLFGGRVVYHSALHDLSMLREMGIETNDLQLDDTMVMAYLLQTEPQGLKPLCVRHTGMAMQSFDDVMGDAGNRLASDYLVSLLDIEADEYLQKQRAELAHLRAQPLLDKSGNPRTTKQGVVRLRNVRALPKLPRSPLHKAAERVLRSRNPRKLWADQNLDIQVAAYSRLGNMDEPTLDHVQPDTALTYACRDADGTCRLAPKLRARITALGLDEVYALELGTYPLIDRMSQVGLQPNLGHFAALSSKLQTHIDTLQRTLLEQTGLEAFNANSGDQVAELLFDKLGLPGSKRTSEGRLSTNDKILEGLEREFGTRYPVVPTIREFRETYKLKNTFVDRIPDFANRYPNDGRIHASFRTTRVVTGRLAASDPNLLAQPKHGKFAPEFRAGWGETDGWVMASWDQSQIELRILAHLSQDPYMLAVFRGEKLDKDGKAIDLHSVMAERLFGVPPHLQDESKHRLPSKAVNFGLPMGMTRYGLAIELRKNGLQVDEDDAQKWIDMADELYVGVPVYKERMIAEARATGMVRCLSGRIRYIGGIRSWDEYVREEAERFAFSTPIQEGAQWVMKQAEAAVWNDIIVPMNKARGHSVDPLIQIHDDLVLRVREELAPELNVMMQWAMTEAPKAISVPLATDGVWGYNWAKQKFHPEGMRKF